MDKTSATYVHCGVHSHPRIGRQEACTTGWLVDVFPEIRRGILGRFYNSVPDVINMPIFGLLAALRFSTLLEKYGEALFRVR